MPNFIKEARVDILNGTLTGTIRFLPGLNLIGGENGTLKTKLLQELRGRPQGHGHLSFVPHAAIPNVSTAELRIQSINPKRNSERRAAEHIWQQFRQQNRTLDVVLRERLSAQINDAAFDTYPSLGELYYLVFEHRAKDGGNRREHMQAVTREFNLVIQSVFQQYSLVADWDDATGAPKIRIRKSPTVEFPIEGLSLGEQEVLSLVTNISAASDTIDVYLIDEPEVHLNWHLEEKLFAFLDDLCNRQQKQAIVATHSRAMFTTRYLPKAQFLYWDEDKIRLSPRLTQDRQRRIAGEAIEIIKLGDFSKLTFFVEDSAHTRLLDALAACVGATITISECLNSSNVKSLFRLAQSDGGWPNTFFMVDGDNEGNPYPDSGQFIHLPVYCADNLLLHPGHLSAVFGRSVIDVQHLLREAILRRREQILKKNKFFDFLMDLLQPDHITYERLAKLDGSEIIDPVASMLATTISDLTRRVISYLHTSGNLEAHLPIKLLDALRSTATTA